MADPFIGEIRAFGFNFQPRGWAFCNGQLLAIQQNTPLYSIIGTTYGGDGTSTFGLPNLQGQIPMHWGNNVGLNTVLGQPQGQSTVTLTSNQLAQHFHQIFTAAAASGAGSERSASPSNASFLSSSAAPNFAYQKAPATPNTPFSPKAISQNGNSQPHENMQPYLVINFCICLEGIFPSRN